MPLEHKTKSTAERILDAAEQQFAAVGYAATSLADIADAVGVRQPSLYSHFASKRDLYVAVMRRLLDPYFELLGELLQAPVDAAQAERNLDAVLTHYVRTPNLARLVQYAALAGGEELDLLVERWYAPLFTRAAELTRDAKLPRHARRTNPVSLVVAFHSLMSGYITMAPLHQRLAGPDAQALAPLAELMRSLARTLWSTEESHVRVDRVVRSRPRRRRR
jgi:AcrR family transcriptional regulator